MAEAVLPDGSVIKVPDFALENTQAQMLATLKVLLKGDKQTQELYEKFLDEVKQGNKDTKKSDEKAQKVLEEIKKTNQEQQKSMRQKFADRVEGDVQGVFVGAGRAVSGLATAAVLATGAIIGFGAKIFTGLTDNIRDLTQAGLGFTDSMGNTASSALVQFNSLGFSAQEATQTMLKFSSLTATLGRTGPGSLVNTIKSFKALTNNGLDLGMSFQDATDALLEELETRSSLGMLEGSVSSRQIAAANEQIKLQTAYASVLGISADKLREMNKQTLSQNTGLVALMSRFGPGVYEAASAFNTVMSSAGDQVGKLGELFLDAGAQSSVFISEAAQDLASAGVGDITNTLIKFGEGLQKGTLTSLASGEAAAKELQNKIGNLNRKQIDDLQKVVESGGPGAEMAKVLILASNQIKEARKKLDEAANRSGISVDELLTIRILFDNSIKELKGAFEALSTSAMKVFAPQISSFAKFIQKFALAFRDSEKDGNKIRGIGTALIDSITKLGNLALKIFGFDPSKLVDSDSLRNSIVTKIDNITKSISDYFEQFMVYKKDEDGNLTKELEKFDWSAMFKDIGKSMVAGILAGIAAVPGMIWDGVTSYIGGLFSSEPKAQADEVTQSIVSSVLTIVGSLFALGAAKSLFIAGLSKIKSMIAGYALGESAESLSKKRSGGLLDRLRGRDGPTPPAGGPTPPGGGPQPGGGGGGAPSGPGKADKIANSLKSLGSGIASLGVGIGRMLASIGKGGGIAIASVFKGIATGVASLGKASVLKGVGVMALLSAPVFLIGEAFQSWKEIEWPVVLTGIGAIGGLAAVAAAMGAGIKFVALGAVAMAGLGLALQLFPVDLVQTIGTVLNTLVNTIMVGMPPIITAVGDALAKLVEVGAKGFDTIMNSVGTLLERISKLDGTALLAAAGGIGAVGLALAGLGAGSVIGGIGSFFGAFVGGDPFDRLIKVSESVPKLVQLSDTLKVLAGVLGQTADVIDRLSVKPLEDIVTQFSKLWKNLANVELNNKQFYDFAAISTDAMLKNADAINKIAAANRAQNLAYTEFIKLDDAKFAKNVKNAYGYNAANAGATEEGGLAQTVKNVFSSLFGNKPATPVDPSKITPQTPQAKNVAESPLLSALQTPVDKDSLGRTPAQILEELERQLKSSNSFLNTISQKV